MARSSIEKEKKAEMLQKRVRELERQLAEARSELEKSRPAVRHEDQIQNNEHLSRALFDAPYPIMIRRDDGRVLMVNAAWTRVTGYTLEDIPTLTEWTRKAYGEQALQREAFILQQGFSQTGMKAWGEYEVRTRSGEVRIWSFSTAPLGYDESGRELVMVMVMDVTEHRQAENARAESERHQKEMEILLELDRARLSTILEMLPVGVWITDNTGQIIGKNRQADQIWAGDAPLLDNVEQYTQYESWYPESGKKLEAEEYPVVQALRTGQPVGPVEMSIRRFDGTEGTVLVSAVPLKDSLGQLTGIVAINVDVTSRRQAEDALRESEQRYRGLFESMQEGLVSAEVITDEQGIPINYRYLDVNPAVERMFNIPREQFIGRTYTEVLPEGDQEWIAILGRVGLTGEPANVERFGRASGRWFEAHAYSPRPGQFINILTDITERKNAEEALRKSEERFSKAFHASPNAIIISRLSDGLIIEVNEGWTSIFGYEPGEVLGRSSLELGVFVNSEDRKEAITQIQKHGALRDFEIQIRRKSGEIRQASMSVEQIELNNANCLLTVMQDITERKLAESALKESEQKFSIMFEKAPFAAALSKLPEGVIVNINEEFERMFGHTRQEATGKTSLQLGINPNQAERAKIQAQIQSSGSARNVETRLYGKSGEQRVYLLNIDMVKIGDEEYALQTAQDITVSKKSAEALQASEARMRAVFHSLVEGVVFLNAQGQVEEINDSVQQNFDHTLEQLSDLRSDPRFSIIRPDGTPFPEEEQPAIVALRTGRSVRDVELGVPLPDGRISWRLVNAQPVYTDDGKLLGAVASFFDITERKNAERELRESTERFHSLADSMPQLVWTALPDGTVDYYNQRYLEYQDIRHVEGEAWEWAPVLHPDDMDTTMEAWQQAVASGTIYQIEHRVRMADGSYRWHLSRGIPARSEDGQIVRWFGTATDIHESKLAEEKLKDYAARLERSNRELEQFAFMASHDLQEPMRKIQVFGDLLLDRAKNLEDHEREYVERMRNAAGRMREMVDGLLHLSRVNTQSKPFTKVNLSQVTLDALSDLAEQVRETEANVAVEPLPDVTGDSLQLRQLMQNLIGNALKYHKPGVPPQVNIHAKQSAETTRIFVQDNGIGFEQEHAERIFQPFQRLVGRSQYEGSGMGLAICRKIVDRHGGEITAQSTPGMGTTFVIALPTYTQPIVDKEHDEH